MPRPGWLNRQFEKAAEDVKNWPAWMKREAGLEGVVRETLWSSGSVEKAGDQKEEGKE